ncbi:hypothetical protein Cadr_000021993 [Camelus dromedarius]|uniref:Uncharacterized protein n=1 Tax=Camelus dromedarius TaxID=9838 RepID=A0A5N4CS58_CAMDR|nr:hypothetical protein Cadr_000021993 [Camelus dromedarius]
MKTQGLCYKLGTCKLDAERETRGRTDTLWPRGMALKDKSSHSQGRTGLAERGECPCPVLIRGSPTSSAPYPCVSWSLTNCPAQAGSPGLLPLFHCPLHILPPAKSPLPYPTPTFAF